MTAKTSRLSIEIPTKDHRKLKMLANALGVSLRELVLGAIDPLVHPKKRLNKETLKVMADTDQGKNLNVCKDLDDFFEKLGIDE